MYQAAEAHHFCVECCGKGVLRTVDLSAVTEIDSAGLQLLLSLARTSSEEPVRLVRPSAAVCAVFSLLHMDELLHETEELTP